MVARTYRLYLVELALGGKAPKSLLHSIGFPHVASVSVIVQKSVWSR